VRRGLRLKKLGNSLIEIVGGRAIHPVNVRVGGFYRAPALEALRALLPELDWAIDAAEETVRFVAGLDFPDLQMDYEFFSLVHPDEYPIYSGRLASSCGAEWAVADFSDALREGQVPHSTALQSVRPDGTPVLLGPMARYVLNRERLTPRARAAAADAGLDQGYCNPYRAIIARAVEILFACEEARRLIEGYRPFEPAAVTVTPQAGEGHGATEAPRGTLYHHYRIRDDGRIEYARIVPPTAVNQARIEADLVTLAQTHLHLDDDGLRALCEQAIRSYDPCISCATHFLKLDIRRQP
jgi:coenzyme F420-reducing hydrogenase alpha subunit